MTFAEMKRLEHLHRLYVRANKKRDTQWVRKSIQGEYWKLYDKFAMWRGESYLDFIREDIYERGVWVYKHSPASRSRKMWFVMENQKNGGIPF